MSRADLVRYAILDLPEGSVLVAGRDGQVVMTMTIGTPEEMVARLLARHPGAEAAPATKVPGVAELKRWLRNPKTDLSAVPVDYDGISPFTARVYKRLRTIPAGSCVTYGDLARMVKAPRAFRAVGQAMARNPFAPFVPCHRVIGSQGAMTGYSALGGVDYKATLLRREGVLDPTDACHRGRSNP